ncbi:hypothetical protein P153DRAFT_328662 [Dothidotthia symphoricarpi CBS 119687]|uniref:Developmental regulator protein n=1 Tax=Dothidotthia symphoricarpi CBS 119687 TaxID=1392245 RepID=A0A6A6AU84_9PLEO|nr:uncharacterized protein P153DRAFT_328662 [Dothidotthia symphoricarpi CBS 119687]KAF2134407.1 hypothetical protein P153DRAFT_328662 [Dothidotthia symphoricarpi CBS 119687]
MPTWLVHGFRWPRTQIRIHTILQNLDDVAPEWLMAPATSACMLENFKKEYPNEMEQMPDLRFIEQYDPEDLTVKDQPYAYVCDKVREVKLGADLDEVQSDGLKYGQQAPITELRDKVAPGEKLGWFVVVNGDVERWAPPLDDDEEDYEDEEYEQEVQEVQEVEDVEDESAETNTITASSPRSSAASSFPTRPPEQERPSTSKSFKNWFGGKVKKARSLRDLKAELVRNEPPPPLPPISPSAALQPPKSSNGKRPGQSESKSMSFRTRWLSSEKNPVST